MAATLAQILLSPTVKPLVIDDCLALIEQEVSSKSGASGTALKLAYKTAKALASGYLRKMVRLLLPEIVEKLEPYWTEFNASGGSAFGDYLAKRGAEVAEDLVSITDEKATASERPAIVSAYQAIRGGATAHVEAALPQVGLLVQKYAEQAPAE